MNHNKYLTLMRREFWEHRTLWLVPTVAAGLLLLAAAFGGLWVNNAGAHISIGVPIQADSSQHVGAVSLLGILATLATFASIGIFTYLLDCLFAERKDRSILFWKSLPVSNAETVFAKLAVAMVVVPLLALVLALVLQPLLAGVVALRFPELRPQLGPLLVGSVRALPHLIGTGVFVLLWYAPVATWLMLASVLARRVPLMYAVLPVVVLGTAEQVVLGTSHVYRFVGGRLLPGLTVGNDFFQKGSAWATSHWVTAFGSPALWLGLAAAAGMLYIVIRLRRYRDDT